VFHEVLAGLEADVAKKKYVDLIKSGVDNWNEWRVNHPSEDIDLSEVDLHGLGLSRIYLWKVNLENANLSHANLYQADLTGTNLGRANLGAALVCEADLKGASLQQADLTGIRLSRSSLQQADLRWANLTEADLDSTDLAFANLAGAELSRADMKNAILAYTILGDTNLGQTKNLGLIIHRAQSIIDQLTLRKSGPLPESFLRGCGLTEKFIHSIPSLFANRGQEKYYSCYISYSHHDKRFVHHLHKVLQARGIRCWLDEKQLLPGDSIFEKLSQGVGLWDKVLICCSESSCGSVWVDRELTLALAKEEQLFKKHKRHVPILIPVNLDNYIFSNEWKSGKRDEIRSRLAANFTGLKPGTPKFKAAFEKLILALRSDGHAREKAPKPKLKA
jgi:hypothetical protein